MLLCFERSAWCFLFEGCRLLASSQVYLGEAWVPLALSLLFCFWTTPVSAQGFLLAHYSELTLHGAWSEVCMGCWGSTLGWPCTREVTDLMYYRIGLISFSVSASHSAEVTGGSVTVGLRSCLAHWQQWGACSVLHCIGASVLAGLSLF